MGVFSHIGIAVLGLWVPAVVLYLLRPQRRGLFAFAGLLGGLGFLLLSIFTGWLWLKLERPPMRTLGETRLWYSLLVPVVGLLGYLRWRFHWFLAYALGLASVFLCLNLLAPENFDKTLMPALQSPWFVPHVVLFIWSYSLLAAATLVAAKELAGADPAKAADRMQLADDLVRTGLGAFTIAMLMGALWAKEAWGHYWTWDPKETWAFLAWCAYLLHLHLRRHRPEAVRTACVVLVVAFVVLLACWFGINFLPAAAGSVHVY